MAYSLHVALIRAPPGGAKMYICRLAVLDDERRRELFVIAVDSMSGVLAGLIGYITVYLSCQQLTPCCELMDDECFYISFDFRSAQPDR
jgi:hypothetical protein